MHFVYNVFIFLSSYGYCILNTSLIPTSPSTSEDTQTSGTDLEEINTEDERNTDTSKWLDKERKKLQHMTRIS